MKIKRIIYTFLIILLLLNMTGCQLALEDKGESNNRDRLIGILVTDEYLDLFDLEGYLNDNINKFSGGGSIMIEGDNREYEGRLYAKLTTKTLKDETGNTFDTREFVFDDVKGIAYFFATVPATEDEGSFTTSGSDEAISDGHMSIHHGDDEVKTSLEGTIYISMGQVDKSLYINPVCQSSDGSVYVTSGNGIMLASEQGEGSAYSQTLEETTTVTENGKSKTVSFYIKISLSIMLPPEKIIIMQMDKNSAIISKKEYVPGNLPDTIIPESDTDYIIVESYKRDSESKRITTRSIFDRRNESFETFYCRDDGICVKQWTSLDWHKD